MHQGSLLKMTCCVVHRMVGGVEVKRLVIDHISLNKSSNSATALA